MTMRRFWVVGGEYADTSFSSLTCASPTVAGPFDDEEQAKAAWRSLYDRPHSALTRFSILHETLRLAS
ncbi:MAG TPA: hypothetical protein VGM25_04915 [Caulobacteraceae bacterium]|jgi:hypothetical protein